MLLIELEGQNSPRFRLEFHPRVTIVSQLSPEMRLRIGASLNSALFGDPTDLSLSVDYGGQPQLLTHELLARVGMLRKTMDNVIAAADLPGAVVVGESSTAASSQFETNALLPPLDQSAWQPADMPGERAPRHIRESVAGSPFEQARVELQEAETYVEELAQKLDAARVGISDVTSEDVDRAADALKQARTITNELRVQIQDLRDQLENPTRESKVVRVMRLRQVESSIDERVRQLRKKLEAPGLDRSEVQRCLAAAVDPAIQQAAVQKRNLLQRLLQRHSEEVALITRLENQPRPPGWLVAQTKDEIDEAQARITAFTYQVKEGIDVKKSLKKAQEQLLEAQSAWDEIENGIEGELRIARDRFNDSISGLADLLKVDATSDVEAAANAELLRLENADDQRVELMNALNKHGLGATVESAVPLANEWLQQQSMSEATHSSIQQQLAAALLDLGGVRKQIADLSNESDALNDRGALTTKIEMLQAEHNEAVRAQRDAEAYHADLSSRFVVSDPEAIAKLEVEHLEALEFVEACGRKVDYFAKLDALRRDDEVFEEPVPEAPVSEEPSESHWWDAKGSQTAVLAPTPTFKAFQVDVSQVSESDIEMYVLSRAAALRSVAHGESVPLILDGTFDDLAPHFALRLLDGLAKISSSVQIVYLASSPVADRWLQGQTEEVAAAVMPELI